MADLLEHVLVPIANEDDADSTCDALESYLDEVEVVTVVHVIEKAGGYMDKAPLEAREEQAERVFSIVEHRLGTDSTIHRELRYGTDVVDEIVDAADEVDATVIGFTPRSGSRLGRFLTGDVSYRLLTKTEQPVIVFSMSNS